MTKKLRPSGAKNPKVEAARAASPQQKKAFTEAHLGMSIEDWRLKKRQQWRAVMNALAAFTYGCAYTPAGNDLYEMQRSADRVKEAMDEDWVCW